jgi:hypothetical protein
VGSSALLLAGATALACANTGEGGGREQQAGAGQGGAAGNGLWIPCEALELATQCAQSSCPESPEEVVPFCTDDFRGTTRSATDCGGTVVTKDFGLGKTNYYFDDMGALMGLSISSDKGRECADGRVTLVTQYGEICASLGEAEDLCLAAPSCSQGAVCGEAGPGFHPCPGALDEFDPDCRYAELIERYASSCGGTVIVARQQHVSQSFTFDEEGNLSGTDATNEQNSHQCWGTPCEPEGEAEVLCTNQGGAPATGEGGAGGADAAGRGGTGGAP